MWADTQAILQRYFRGHLYQDDGLLLGHRNLLPNALGVTKCRTNPKCPTWESQEICGLCEVRTFLNREKEMSGKIKSLLLIAVAALFAVNSFAQTTDTPKRTEKKGAAVHKTKSEPPKKDLSAELDKLQGKLDQAQTQIQQQQTQIESLQKSLQDSIGVLQQQQQQLQVSVQKANEQAAVARNTAAEA